MSNTEIPLLFQTLASSAPIQDLKQERDILKKQLRYRSWHRGTKEADLLMGTFADNHLDSLTADELKIFQQLLTEKDVDIMDWIFEQKIPPSYIPSHFIDKIRTMNL